MHAVEREPSPPMGDPSEARWTIPLPVRGAASSRPLVPEPKRPRRLRWRNAGRAALFRSSAFRNGHKTAPVLGHDIFPCRADNPAGNRGIAEWQGRQPVRHQDTQPGRQSRLPPRPQTTRPEYRGDELQDKVVEFGSVVPMGRRGRPEEVATRFGIPAFGDRGCMIGQVLHPNCGTVANGCRQRIETGVVMLFLPTLSSSLKPSSARGRRTMTTQMVEQ